MTICKTILLKKIEQNFDLIVLGPNLIYERDSVIFNCIFTFFIMIREFIKYLRIQQG